MMCEGETIVVFAKDGVNAFSVCLTCNPAKTIEEMIAGCEAVCCRCFKAVQYDADYNTPCMECKKLICYHCEHECHVDGPDEDGTYHCSDACYRAYLDK